MDIITKIEILLTYNGYNKEYLECDGVGQVDACFSSGTEKIYIQQSLGCTKGWKYE